MKLMMFNKDILKVINLNRFYFRFRYLGSGCNHLLYQLYYLLYLYHYFQFQHSIQSRLMRGKFGPAQFFLQCQNNINVVEVNLSKFYSFENGNGKFEEMNIQLSSSHVTVYSIVLLIQLILNSSFQFQLDQVTVGKEQIQELISRIKLNQYLLASLMAQVCQASYRWRQPEYQLLPLYLAAKNFQMVQNNIIIIKLIIDSF
ncbi:Hypothetical_protein [Hexamita inflata]|uniref:Hypothetical_protein n=1 Tax=Hexamita inflata TaxID=28002 RepID=A0AA86Q3D5_9EUKA|nr:Hypothetical protein HINF_LOCUS36563 [Hexamita inflata]